MQLKERTALVTGASSGLGTHFARKLAARGANLVITARRQDRLEALATEIRTAHGVEVTVITLDLAEPSGAEALFNQTEGAGLPIDILINNAGFGTRKPFAETPWPRSQSQLQLNVTALTELTYRFVRAMTARQRGWILNVASLGAYLAIPGYASYAAGKAYVRNFTEALAFETAGTGVTVTCLCPGATATEFTAVAGHDLASWQELAMMSAERCAEIGLKALFRGRRNMIAGVSNTLIAFLLRLAPRRMATWIASHVMA